MPDWAPVVQEPFTCTTVLLAQVQLCPKVLLLLAQEQGRTSKAPLGAQVPVQFVLTLLLPGEVALGVMGHAMTQICAGRMLLTVRQEQLEGSAGVSVLVHVVLTVALVQEQLKLSALCKQSQGRLLLFPMHRLLQFCLPLVLLVLSVMGQETVHC